MICARLNGRGSDDSWTIIYLMVQGALLSFFSFPHLRYATSLQVQNTWNFFLKKLWNNHLYTLAVWNPNLLLLRYEVHDNLQQNRNDSNILSLLHICRNYASSDTLSRTVKHNTFSPHINWSILSLVQASISGSLQWSSYQIKIPLNWTSHCGVCSSLCRSSNVGCL